MKRRPSIVASQRARGRCPKLLGDDGSVAVELALLASFFLVPLLLGIIQYGLYFNATQSLAACPTASCSISEYFYPGTPGATVERVGSNPV